MMHRQKLVPNSNGGYISSDLNNRYANTIDYYEDENRPKFNGEQTGNNLNTSDGSHNPKSPGRENS